MSQAKCSALKGIISVFMVNPDKWLAAVCTDMAKINEIIIIAIHNTLH